MRWELQLVRLASAAWKAELVLIFHNRLRSQSEAAELEFLGIQGEKEDGWRLKWVHVTLLLLI